MSIKMKTIMGQLNIVDGQWVNEAPNALAVREPPSQRRVASRKGDLFVVLDLRGHDGQSLAGHQLSQSLAETIRNVYYQTPSSMTASLRHAVTAANAQLMAQADRTVGSEEKTGAPSPLLAGVTVVVVLGEDVFIATVGPAVTYVVTNGIATQFPESSPWLGESASRVANAPALGREAEAPVQLFHASLRPGDAVVMGDGRFAVQVSSEEIEEAVAFQSIEDALASLNQMAGAHDCTALLVENQAVRAGAARVRRSASAWKAALSRRITARVQPDEDIGRPARQRPAGFQETVPLGRWLSTLGKGGLALLMMVWVGLRTLLSRILPNEAPEIPATRPIPADLADQDAVPALSLRGLRTVAFIIPAVVLIVVAITYWQRGIAQENEYVSLMENAQAAFLQALDANDDQRARDWLGQADDSLTRAKAIRPDEAAGDELWMSIVQYRDKVDRVERLYWVGSLRMYDNPLTQLRRVISDGLDLYVLDTGADQVYHHRLDDMGDSLRPDAGDPVLVQRAQQVATTVVGEIIDMTWMPVSTNRQTSGLLILEGEGLLEYSPKWNLTAVPIVGTEGWILPVAVAGYDGNLYILDPQAGQILRYVPGPDGYTTPPEHYLSPDLKDILVGGIDMAIDGFIYVLYADGTVRKFEGGAPAPFEIMGIDRPLSNPTAIYTGPDHLVGFVYIADAGNQRIVQLHKDGRFVRQIKPREDESIPFDSLKSIFVDESANKLYFLDNHSLYIANIPPVQ